MSKMTGQSQRDVKGSQSLPAVTTPTNYAGNKAGFRESTGDPALGRGPFPTT